MQFILQYLKEYRWKALLAPLFKMLEASFELVVPLVMAAMIDHGIRGNDQEYVIRMGLLLILLALIGCACSVAAQYFAAVAAAGSASLIRTELFSKIMSFSYSDIDRIGTSTLETRMTSDVTQIQTGINMLLRLFLRSPFIVLGAVIMAFTVDWKTALVFAVVLPVLSLVVFLIVFKTVPMYEDVQNSLDKVTLKTRESLTGIRVIRAFNREEMTEGEFRQEAASLTQKQLKVGGISSLMNPLTYVIVNLGIAAILWFGGLRINTGSLTQGQIVALINYMSQILVELVKLANLIITTTKAFAAADRVEDILKTSPGQTYPAQTPEEADSSASEEQKLRGDVDFSHVSICYPGAGADTLTDISFHASPGDTIGIIGGTGSGKSTLVNLIPRFYDATAGEVRIDGIRTDQYEKDRLRRKIAVVPQKAELFTGTIAENMRWGNPKATDAEIWEALRIAVADDFVRNLGGLSYRIEQNAKNVSGGQRQRLTIARALLKRPEILILDDSSSALDFATDAALRKNLKKLSGTTTFLVSQRAFAVSRADQILVLSDGTLAGIGTHQELMENCQVYQEICRSQNYTEEGRDGK